MPEKAITFIDGGTTFRWFNPRTVRRCGMCRGVVDAGAPAWRPAANEGDWKPDAVICAECGENAQKRK